MFAVYATHSAPDDPLSALKVGELPEPSVPDTAESRSCEIVPMTSPVLATLIDCMFDGRMVTISAAHIGRSTSPSESIG